MFLIHADYNGHKFRGYYIITDSHKPVLRIYLKDYNHDPDACYKHAVKIVKLLNDD